MTEEDNQSKEILTRDQILKVNDDSTEYQLPSGNSVDVAFLSWRIIQEIEKSIEPAPDEDKGHFFTRKVVEWMLRKSDQKDYQEFSNEDQRRLVEIAVEKWGCEDEYEQLTELNDPEVRFYNAVQLQENELVRQLSESVRAVSVNLASALAPLQNIEIEPASLVKGMQGLLSEFSRQNARVLEQMGNITRFQPPILSFAKEMAKTLSSAGFSENRALLESVSGTISSYKNLMQDILPVERFAVLPDSVRYFPTIEMRNTSIVAAHFVEETTYEPQEDIITPEKTDLLEWLDSLDPTFPSMLHGAEQTIDSQNPDRCRHFASSHRELSTHLLHLLAPDSEVKQWTEDPNHYNKDGKPTRRTRLKYIARNHKNDAFIDFVTNNFENQMALLNADEHRKTHNYSTQQLMRLHKCFLSTLGFLREINSSKS